tara:strand:+ start:1038 stop:1472 length:435 start_codon:yes stop_codon:yes gene_type:complete
MKPELAKVGPAWEGGNIERWPGVAGIPGETNHLGRIDPFLPDPIDSSSNRDIVMKGGQKKTAKKSRKGKRVKKSNKGRSGIKSRKKRKTKRRKRGGSKHGNTLLPQSLVNLGRSAQYNIKGVWSDFTSSHTPVNPDPSVQPIGK